MKYTITGTYDKNKNFHDLIEGVKSLINLDSINAGYGRFYFESNNLDSKEFSEFEEILNRDLRINQISNKKSKLLEYINDNAFDLNEEFTVIKPSQNYYNLLKYLEK
jgi:hypothetical protein